MSPIDIGFAVWQVLVAPIVWIARFAQDAWGRAIRVTVIDGPPANEWMLGLAVALTGEDVAASPKRVGDVYPWLRQRKQAFHLGEWDLRLLVSSRSRAPIVITDVAAIIEAREETSLRAVVINPPAGDLHPRRIGFDLTKGRSSRGVVIERDETGEDRWTGEPAWESLLQIDGRSNAAITITTRTGADIVRWRLRLTYSTDRRGSRTYVYPPGRRPPFVTCGQPQRSAEQIWMTGVACSGPPFLRPQEPMDRGEC